jgi:hypothetical protein
MKKLRTLAILAVVLLALGGLATWDEWKTGQEEKQKEATTRLTGLKPDQVTEIEFSSHPEAAEAGGDSGILSMHLVKKDGLWRLTKPIDSAADSPAVENLLKSITDYNYSGTVTSEKTRWAEFGLDPATTTITLKAADPKDGITLFFGTKSPVGYNGYLATSNSNDVLMGSQHILTAVNKTLFDLRDKSLVKIEEADVKTLTYQSTAGAGVFLTKADGRYRYADDTTAEPDGAYIRDFIDDLNFVRVEKFIDNPEDALAAKFQDPEITVSFTFENKPELRLEFVASGDRMYGSIEGNETLFELPADFAKKIQKKPNDFRNRRIVDGKFMGQVSKVTIDGTEYAKVEGNWYTGEELKKAQSPAEGGALPLESAHIRPFMVDLEFAKTEDFYAPDHPDYGKAVHQAPQHRIVLETTGDSPQKLTIELFKHELLTDKFWVRVSGASTGYLVGTGNFESIKPAPVGQPEPPASEG